MRAELGGAVFAHEDGGEGPRFDAEVAARGGGFFGVVEEILYGEVAVFHGWFVAPEQAALVGVRAVLGGGGEEEEAAAVGVQGCCPLSLNVSCAALA